MSVEGVEATYEYTGKPVTPTVTVKSAEGKLLYKDIDYIVEYKDNIGTTVPGTSGKPDTIDMVTPAVITVKGMGNYTGELTKNFTFTMSTLYKQATVIKNTLYNSYYSTTYEWLNTISEKNPTAYEMILKNLNSTLNRVEGELEKEGYTLNDIMSYTLYPDASKCLNDYYRHINEKSGLVLEDIVEAPEVSSNTIKSDSVAIQLSGQTTETSTINKDTTSVQLSVADAKESPSIDPNLYDAVSAVSLDIGITIDNEQKTELSFPITITMNIPEGFSADDDLVVLHYATDLNNPEELSVVKDTTNGTFSFVTNSFSPYVITKKVEQYDSGQTEAPSANDENQTGVSFGEEDDEGPGAPSNVKAYYSANNEITVEWDAVAGKEGWTITGYKVAYSTSEDMSNATEFVSASTLSKAVLTGLDAGTYYITVSTVADSEAIKQMERKSVTTSTELYTPLPEPEIITYTVTTTNGTIQNPKESYNYKDRVTVTAPASTEEGIFAYWKDASDNILCYASTYSFYVTSSVTLTAVYETEEAPVEKQAVVSCSAVYDTNTMKIKFTASRSVPVEVTNSSQVVEHGIILTKDASLGVDEENFVIGADNIVKSTAKTTKGLLGTYNVSISCASGTTIYGRGYVTYIDKNGAEQTIYSNIALCTRE